MSTLKFTSDIFKSDTVINPLHVVYAELIKDKDKGNCCVKIYLSTGIVRITNLLTEQEATQIYTNVIKSIENLGK